MQQRPTLCSLPTRRIVRILFPLCVALALAASAAAARAGERYEVFRVPQPPEIDGKLDDQAWSHVPMKTGFTVLNHHDMYMDPRWQTEFRAGYDGDALYLGIRAHEARLDEHLAHAKKKDTGEANWHYQLVEILLDPRTAEETAHYHLAIDLLNRTVAYKAETEGRQEAERGTKWRKLEDFPLRSAVAYGDKQFTVEAAVPFAGLGAHPEPADAWGAQVGRHGVWSYDGLSWRLCQWSEWSPSPNGHWKWTVEHGELVFMPEILIPDSQNVGKRSDRLNAAYITWTLTQGAEAKRVDALAARTEGLENLLSADRKNNRVRIGGFGTERLGLPRNGEPVRWGRGEQGMFTGHPEVVLCTWDEPVRFNCNTLGWRSPTQTASAYALEYWAGGAWRLAYAREGNTLPRDAQSFEPVTSDRVRFTVFAAERGGAVIEQFGLFDLPANDQPNG